MSQNIKHLKDGTVRAEVALVRTFCSAVEYPQWKKKCWASSLLPHRQSGESAMFLVKDQCSVHCSWFVGVCVKFVLFVFQCNSI